MILDCMLLGASAKIASDAVTIEFLKSKQRFLNESEKQEITGNKDMRFVHFTSKENAEKIMASGFLIPTKGILKNHFTKKLDKNGKNKNSDMVYMFDSETFSVDDYIRNLPLKRSPYNGVYEYYAISTKPNEYSLNNFKRRAQDGAITYDGRLDIDGTDTKICKYVLDLDKDGNYVLNERDLKDEYIPSEALLKKLEKDKSNKLVNNIKYYTSELKKSKTSLKRFKVEKEEYKNSIQKEKEFAKANKQYKQEEKEKSYIYTKNNRTIVVKGIELDKIDGKLLQKVAIIENSKANGRLEECTKLVYMDEFDIGNIDSKVACEYFFNNLDNINQNDKENPEYIGLPLENLEEGIVQNDYDKKFREHYNAKVKRKQYADRSFEENIASKKLGYKIKRIFSRIFNKNIKMLNEPKSETELEETKKLNELGYSSVEAMNKDDKNITILDLLEKQVDVNYDYYIKTEEEKSMDKKLIRGESDVCRLY